MAAARLTPTIDVSETDKEVTVEAELPGVDEKDIDVTLGDNMLTIKGEKKQEKEEKKKDYHLTERSYGSFSRSMVLPFDADPGEDQGGVQGWRADGHPAETARGQSQGQENCYRQVTDGQHAGSGVTICNVGEATCASLFCRAVDLGRSGTN